MTTADIVNLALDHLHWTQKVAAITDATLHAQAANRWFAILRRQMIEFMPWKFATRRTVLTRNTSTTFVHPSWEYAYDLPTSMLKAWGFVPYRSRNLPWNYTIPFAVEMAGDGSAQKIYSDYYMNSQDAFEYSVDVTDSASFPEHFAVALSYALAVKMASALRVDESIVKEVAALWIAAWNDALGRENADKTYEVPDASWVTARY